MEDDTLVFISQLNDIEDKSRDRLHATVDEGALRLPDTDDLAFMHSEIDRLIENNINYIHEYLDGMPMLATMAVLAHCLAEALKQVALPKQQQGDKP